MNQKKVYSTPSLYRVDLNPEQAILSACSLMTMNGLVGFGNNTVEENRRASMLWAFGVGFA